MLRFLQRPAASAEANDVLAMRARLAALDRSYAVIEFTPTGEIVSANANFLAALGYRADEIVGKHHSMFVDERFRGSAEYREFWAKLGRGEPHAGKYQRIAKGGREIWIQATYDPIRDAQGRLTGVIKHATDVTAEQTAAAAVASKLAAVDRQQAVIEFTVDGQIVAANANFLAAMGYGAAEIVGQHHGLFVDAKYRASSEYREFWAKLGRGEHHAGRFERFAKHGRRVWIDATYSPILAPDGRVVGVVKYATEVTAQVEAEQALHAALAESRDVIAAVRAGDLLRRVSLDGRTGSLLGLMEGVNAIIETLVELVGRVQESSGQISTAASEIAQGNTDLSSRTEEQASSLEQTASSMEELTGTVKQNAENARQASELAIGASAVATRGGEVVSQVVRTMSGIADASKKIADIISVIDAIAFQTNILALNAAVEAARAGEQGRGFAVVASEVRNLAQKSATAAKEIKTLITDSVNRVDAGAEQVRNAGATMQEIVTSVKRVTDIVAEITAASAEQASGIEQVNQAIGQMDQMTQQNAALVEQAAAAAESLGEQAQSLAQAASAFRISDDAPRWDGVTERRGPDRAKNVARMAPAKPAPKQAKAVGDWEEM